MKHFLTLTLLTSIFLVGCASTTFRTFETRGSGVIEGNGGTKTVKDGMDIWETGDPPRRFRILGVIEDERPDAVVPMAMLRTDMVKKAREVGGDALILLRSQSQIVGYQTMGNASTTAKVTQVPASSTAYGTAETSSVSTTLPFKRNAAQFVVIKYVD